jgi:hypothetical protein
MRKSPKPCSSLRRCARAGPSPTAPMP